MGNNGLSAYIDSSFLTLIHAPRVGSDLTNQQNQQLRDISIHAPRVGSDENHCRPGRAGLYFNPRSPCGERPVRPLVARAEQAISIHAPRVGSDHSCQNYGQHHLYFNPRFPCGERRAVSQSIARIFDFNPRSPCGERPPLIVYVRTDTDFNPRSPCGERPGDFIFLLPGGAISIHAPRVGSDGSA